MEAKVPSCCSNHGTCLPRSALPGSKPAKKAAKVFTARKKQLQRIAEEYRLRREGKKLRYWGSRLEAYVNRELVKFDARDQ